MLDKIHQLGHVSFQLHQKNIHSSKIHLKVKVKLKCNKIILLIKQK